MFDGMVMKEKKRRMRMKKNRMANLQNLTLIQCHISVGRTRGSIQDGMHIFSSIKDWALFEVEDGFITRQQIQVP